MRVELTEMLWMDRHQELSLTEITELSGLSEIEIHELVDCGVIAPFDSGDASGTFGADSILAARTARRLRDDFDLDAAGLALALTLLERVHDLEAQLAALRAQKPSRIR